MPGHDRTSSRAARARRIAALAPTDRGFALVEVIVTTLLVALIATLLTGLIAAGRTSGDQRSRSQADEVAQQDQERMRGMSLEQLAGLSQTRTVTLDGTTFNVSSTGQFLSSSSNASTCSSTGSGTADYVKVVSSVTWLNNARIPVVEQSVIAPPAGGTLLTRVVDQNASALSGATVTAVPTSAAVNGSYSATTDSSGCTIFSAVAVGDYTITASRTGYVDANGNSSPHNTATATAGNTATSTFTIGQAGSITAPFQTTVGSTTYTGQYAPAMSWSNTGMATFGTNTPGSPATSLATTTSLFPFITTGTGVYANNYSVWAGRCSTDTPPDANASYATVSPGAAGTVTTPPTGGVKMPALIVIVNYQNFSSTTRVQPDHVLLTDSCGQSWRPTISASAATNSLGSFSFPGQPYSLSYTICADENGYKKSATSPNTNFISGTSVTLTVDSRSSSNLGTC